MLQEYVELNEQKKQIEKRLRELKEQMREQPEGFAEGDWILVKSKRNRSQLDKAEVLKRLGPEAFSECEQVTEYEVIFVEEAGKIG